jgi:hypothetical protein
MTARIKPGKSGDFGIKRGKDIKGSWSRSKIGVKSDDFTKRMSKKTTVSPAAVLGLRFLGGIWPN